jgi:5-methylcytosine-specific restriction endonuclease McrA
MANIESFLTLKLDAAYRPLEVIDSLEALVMCIVGKAKVVEVYDSIVRSPSKAFKLPSVIILQRLVKYRIRALKCTRINIFKRDKHTCQYCGKKFSSSELTLDHVIPKSRGGEKRWNNIVAACRKCNQAKGNKTPKESNMLPINKPIRPKSINFKFQNFSDPKHVWKSYLWF